ncbi:YMGG-like glycine zipper-containing protein [Hydrogenobaculum acidophilum]
MRLKGVFCLLISASCSFAFDFNSLLNTVQNIEKALPVKNTNTANSAQSRSLNLNSAQTNASNHEVVKSVNSSCKYMLEHSPKDSVVESTAKYMIGGAIAGALAGALLDKNRAQGAIVGAIGGALAGVGYSYYKNQEKLRTSPEDLAKKINYDYKSPYFRFENIIINGNAFSPGQYIPMIFRFDILKPDKHEGALVSYYATLYRNNIPISSFYDVITLPQGGVSDVFAIPVCKGAVPGNYTLYVRAVSSGIQDIKEASWVVK